MTKIGLYDIVKSTTLESNKSHCYKLSEPSFPPFGPLYNSFPKTE